MVFLLTFSGIVVVLDQLTKWLAVEFLKTKGSLALIPHVFHLSYVENTGIAFGLFQHHPKLLTFMIGTGVVILVFYAPVWFRSASRLKQIAYSMILGGAIGNLIDRIRFQYVIDFLDFRVWPVFNVADSCITIGVLMLMWLVLRRN